jgi:hypothetical protein
MFHYSNFGSFSGELARFADLRGYVPQEGNRHESMEWDALTKWDDESWAEFVAAAVDATERATAQIEEAGLHRYRFATEAVSGTIVAANAEDVLRQLIREDEWPARDARAVANGSWLWIHSDTADDEIERGDMP